MSSSSEAVAKDLIAQRDANAALLDSLHATLSRLTFLQQAAAATGGAPLDTMVDVGAGFMVRYELPSVKEVTVDVGAGFCRKLPLDAAMDVTQHRIDTTSKEADLIAIALQNCVASDVAARLANP